MHARLTWHINPEIGQTRHGDKLSVIDGCIKNIHGERGWTVDDGISRVQHTAHEEVYELVCATTHLLRDKSPASATVQH